MDAKGQIAKFLADGQKRTKWLNQTVGDTLGYFLGPTGIPERLNAAGMLNPVQDIYEAGANARDGDYAGAAVNTAAALAPIGAWKLAGSPMDEVAGVLSDTMTGVGMKAQGVSDWGGEFARAEDGMFLGPSALNADLGALETAKRMASEGADRNAIWNDTGWFKGVDGKWRFEIDDSAMAFTPDTPVSVLSDAVQHDDVFTAYPHMPSEAFRRGAETDFQGNRVFSGLYSPIEGFMVHDDLGRIGGRSVALHEMQHSVQDFEKFARGGNPAEFYPEDIINQISDLDGISDALLGRSWTAPTPEARSAMRSEYDAMRKQMAALRRQAAEWRHDQYNRLSGEVEARNVQTRRDFTPEQRRATPPWETQDVPDSAQIVRFGDGSTLSEIVRKYGIAGAAALTGMTAAEVEAAIGQNEPLENYLK